MTTRDFSLIPVSLLVCATACGLLPGSGDDDSGAPATASDDDDGSATEDPSTDPDDTGDDSDPSGGDPSGGDPSDGDPSGDPTGNPTGEPGDALPDSVLVYLHDEAGSADSIRAYDVETDETWQISDLGGAVTITDVAIDPTRTTLAISAYYDLLDPDESQGLWAMPAAGGELSEILPAMGSSNGEGQSLTNLAWAPDGAYIYFDQTSTATGSGVLARANAAGGALPELFFDASGTCTNNAIPTPDPSGTQLLALHDGCVDISRQGLVLHDAPPSSLGDVMIAKVDGFQLQAVTPIWSADGEEVLFVIYAPFDSDGDGANDGEGGAVMLWNLPSAQIFELVSPTNGVPIRSISLSPDERYLAMCMGGAGNDIVVADLSGEAISYRTITQDGASCSTTW